MGPVAVYSRIAGTALRAIPAGQARINAVQRAAAPRAAIYFQANDAEKISARRPARDGTGNRNEKKGLT
jgi:hypothetical protein